MSDDPSCTETVRPVTPPRTGSFADPLCGIAAVDREAISSSGVPVGIGSLSERFSTAVAGGGTPEARRPDGTREIRSPTEPISAEVADTGAHPPDAPPKDRSLTEPISTKAANPPNPWRRTAEHEEREARADEIGLLVSRWEIGTVHRIHALAASHDLGVREFLVLSELVARPGGLTGSQLTGVVGGGRARMSVLLRGLEDRARDLREGGGLV